jgi:hypothetical protein
MNQLDIPENLFFLHWKKIPVWENNLSHITATDDDDDEGIFCWKREENKPTR